MSERRSIRATVISPWKRRIRFQLERVLLRGTHYRLLLAAAIVVVISVVAGLFLVILDRQAGGLGESIWWAFLRLTDPGYLGDDEGAARRVISTIVTVLGYVLFLGLLIAILTQWLQHTIGDLERGVTPIAIRDHALVLGWTDRTPTIVYELLKTKGRVNRFLARRGARRLRIVVLAEEYEPSILQELREQLGEAWKRGRVFVRSGSPLRLDHLERVAYQDASVIILPGADFTETRPRVLDAQTIKTLMSVSKYVQQAKVPFPPQVIASLFDARRESLAQGAYAGGAEVICADVVIGRMLAQCVRHPGLPAVITELLTLYTGSAVFVRAFPERRGARIEKLRAELPRAIVLGVVHRETRAVHLNLPDDAELGEGQSLVLMAPTWDDTALTGHAPPSEVPERRTDTTVPPRESPHRVLVLGWSHKVPALLREFASYGEKIFEVDIVSMRTVEQREQLARLHGGMTAALDARQIEADYTDVSTLRELAPEQYETIVLMASDRLGGGEEADANTLLARLALRAIFKGLPADQRPNLVIEMMDPDNRSLVSDRDDEVLVSPMLVSYIISQASLAPELANIFEQLFGPGGGEIAFAPAANYVAPGTTVRFQEIEGRARARDEMALGVRRSPEEPGGAPRTQLNPGRYTDWTLGPGDEVIVLRTSRYEAD